jgi:hypothetical protein
MELIENFQEMDENHEWDLFIENDQSWTCWLAKNGSMLSQSLPFLHWEFRIDKKYPFSTIVDSVTNTSKRKKWDKEIKQIWDFPGVSKDSKIVYSQFQNYKLLGAVDCAEKRLWFETENEEDDPIFISYSSSVPEKIMPTRPGVSRMKTVFWITIFEKQRDGSTFIQTYAQFDAGARMRKKYLDHDVSRSEFYNTLPTLILHANFAKPFWETTIMKDYFD